MTMKPGAPRQFQYPVHISANLEANIFMAIEEAAKNKTAGCRTKTDVLVAGVLLFLQANKIEVQPVEAGAIFAKVKEVKAPALTPAKKPTLKKPKAKKK